MTSWTVRDERPGDEAGIGRVTEAAFAGHPHSEGTEPAIVDALRADGDLALSLVAQSGAEIIGHVAFSLAILSGGVDGWFALGPISVVPERQRQGIARTLLETGVARLRGAGAHGVVLIGDPDFYGRFGFVRGTALRISGPLNEYFQVLPFTDRIPASAVEFAPAFRLARIRGR